MTETVEARGQGCDKELGQGQEISCRDRDLWCRDRISQSCVEIGYSMSR